MTNSQTLRTLVQRYKALTLLVVLLTSVIVVYGVMSGAAQSPAKQDGVTNSNIQRPPGMPGPFGEDIAKEFNDDDLKVKGEKPRGRWGFGLLFDKSQFDDSSVPVAVGGIQSLSGAGRHQGVIKIKRVELKNRSPRIVSSVQLRWTIASLGDPAKVLSEGSGQLVNIWIEANSSQVIDIPTLYPALLFKPLAKDGELNGRFQLTIGVQEARFADGSFWRRQEPVAFLKFVYFDHALDSQFPALASTVLGTFPPPDKVPNHRIEIAPWEAEPRSTASAFSFMPVQTRSCVENMASFFDEEGKQSCSQPAPGIACYSDCSSTGHCNVWERLGPCDPPPPPPPSPTPPRCEGPNPGADCCFEDVRTVPGFPPFCVWNCEGCPPGTTLNGGCVSSRSGNCPDGFEPSSQGAGVCCPQVAEDDGGGGVDDCGNACLSCEYCVGYKCEPVASQECASPQAGCYCSPILVDVLGDGFRLTSAAGGVLFDMNGDGAKGRMAWTAPGSDDAFLILDRDGDGRVESGAELFGNFTPQPPSPNPHGFLALAVLDGPGAGGNGDGVIDARDAVFSRLRLWQDQNHNGLSEPGELHELSALHVAAVELDFRESKRTDSYGNKFRFRAKVWDEKRARVGRWAWDVFFVPAR